MAKVRNTLTWAAFEARLREFLDIPSGSDNDLQELLDAATRAADRYMNNHFLDSDGGDIDPLPLSVQRGVLEWIKIMTTTADLVPGAATVKTGDLMQSFVGGPGFDADKAALRQAKKYWMPFRQRWDR